MDTHTSQYIEMPHTLYKASENENVGCFFLSTNFTISYSCLQVCDRAGIRFEYNKSQALKEEVYMVCSLAFGTYINFD